MARKRNSILSPLALIFLLAVPLAAAEGSIYGHISFIDNGATVLRMDGAENQGVINMPLAPGDTIITPAGGRCELQFDNGTVVRLDKDSRLRLATVLAPSLTSNWEITTLELEKGQLYALPQSYEREMFQIVTPNAAASLKTRVRAFIRLDADGGTSFFSDGGKFQLLYGANSRFLKKATVKVDRPIAITAANAPAERVEKRDIEFMGWNEYVDRHFKELHYGINKVPANLTKFKNKALLYWAEKWSSRFGEWIYDELFGYVWCPADERFAFSQRPFFQASFARINGQLFLIPQEQWGWVPAHMGTWVWLKRGWTWIPGDWFHNGIVDFNDSYMFPTLGYYWSLYHWQPRPAGDPEMPYGFYKKPRLPQLPGPVLDIVKKVAKAPDSDGSKRQAIDRVMPAIDGRMLPPVLVPQVPPPGRPVPARARMAGNAGSDRGEVALTRDWNPDSHWAARNRLSIRYSSVGNTVICPELKVSSERITGVDRMILRGGSVVSGGDAARGAVSPPPASSTAGSVTGAAEPAQAGSVDGAKAKDGEGK
jgi:hypothetical protein